MKRILTIAVLAIALAFAMTGLALANYGPHGGYLTDTDACAGCHRAHTAMSSLTWSEPDGTEHSGLLVSSATTMDWFCYACHGNNAPGAATNVYGGVLDTAILGDPEAGTGEVGKVLNGGGIVWLGFGNGAGTARNYGSAARANLITQNVSQKLATSQHDVDGSGTWGAGSVIWGSWGPGTTAGPGSSVDLNCTNCHDPHGSSNYRILNDSVQGRTVGGYVPSPGKTFADDPDPTPDPWILSNEIGYPNGVGGVDEGFRLHKQYWHYDGPYEAGDYAPDYTNAAYSWPVDGMFGVASDKGMSGWCTRACHDQYLVKTGNLENPGTGTTLGTLNEAGAYRAVSTDATPGVDGSYVRHRHPISVPLENFNGDRVLLPDPRAWQDWDATIKYVDLPLLHEPVAGGQGSYDNTRNRATGQVNTMEDGIDCLTCHRAHGTDAVMTGYADSFSNVNPAKDTGIGNGGTPPTNDSALLRANNRGVCERCHNK